MDLIPGSKTIFLSLDITSMTTAQKYLYYDLKNITALSENLSTFSTIKSKSIAINKSNRCDAFVKFCKKYLLDENERQVVEQVK